MTGPARISGLTATLRLLEPLLTRAGSDRRVLVGFAGAPGIGKSTLAAGLAEHFGARAAVVPLDGFHLADAELERQGLLGRKGTPETFDPWGYAALLARLKGRPAHTVYAPGFERELEQPLAGLIAVGPEVELVVTEGNYLLLDDPAWAAAKSELDAVWFVRGDPEVRRGRLLDRHVRFGKTADAAARWMSDVDEPNAALVEASAPRADAILDLTDDGS